MDNEFIEMLAKPVLNLAAVCGCLFFILIAMNLVDAIFDLIKGWIKK